MPTDIVLADAQATPVNHTFSPTGPDQNGVYWFVDKSSSNAIGFWKISVEVKQPGSAQSGQSADGRTFRYKIGLHEPVLETPGVSAAGYVPAARVAYVPRSFTEFVIPERALELDRKNIRKMGAALLANAQIIEWVENLKYVT